MKNSFSNKIFPVAISIIVICAVIHVFFTIKNYNNILTAVLLWMRVTFVIIFWGIIVIGHRCLLFYFEVFQKTSMKSRFYHNKIWKESFSFGQQPELRRMLLVGHGVLCTVDLTDAAIRSVDLITFIMHLNVAAWSRLAISGIQEVRVIYKANFIDIEALDDDLEIEWRNYWQTSKCNL